MSGVSQTGNAECSEMKQKKILDLPRNVYIIIRNTANISIFFKNRWNLVGVPLLSLKLRLIKYAFRKNLIIK